MITYHTAFVNLARELSNGLTRLAVVQEDLCIGANAREMISVCRELHVLHELRVRFDGLKCSQTSSELSSRGHILVRTLSYLNGTPSNQSAQRDDLHFRLGKALTCVENNRTVIRGRSSSERSLMSDRDRINNLCMPSDLPSRRPRIKHESLSESSSRMRRKQTSPEGSMKRTFLDHLQLQ